MIEFACPWMFIILPLPLLLNRIIPAYKAPRLAVQVPFFRRLAQITGEKPSHGSVVLKRMQIQKILLSVFWLGLVGALAGPEWVDPPVVRIKSARDLMVVVDISGTMDEDDFTWNGDRLSRLDAVKQVLKTFVLKRRHDRLGLIVFGSSPYLQAPFTRDHETWLTLLGEACVGMAGPKTHIGDAIGLAVYRFRQSETKNKVLILLTDGNDSGSRVPPVEAAKVAMAEQVKIYTIAIGDPATLGASALDIKTLEKIARITGGEHFLALNTFSLERIYKKINLLEPEAYETLSYHPRKNIHYLFLGAVFLIYLLFFGLMSLIVLFNGKHASNARSQKTQNHGGKNG